MTVRSNMTAFLDLLEFVKPLNPHDAFCGGRSNAVSLYQKEDAS